jgi:hypothetical protein
MAQEAWQERESLAEALRLSWQEEGADPLLSTLADLRQQRLRLEADMRLLIAYDAASPPALQADRPGQRRGLSLRSPPRRDDDEINQAAGPPSPSRPMAMAPSRRRNEHPRRPDPQEVSSHGAAKPVPVVRQATPSDPRCCSGLGTPPAAP